MTATLSTKNVPLDFWTIFCIKKFRTFLSLIIVMVIIFVLTVRHDYNKYSKNDFKNINYRVKQRQENVDKVRKSSAEKIKEREKGKVDLKVQVSDLNEQIKTKKNINENDEMHIKKDDFVANKLKDSVINSKQIVENQIPSNVHKSIGPNPLDALGAKQNDSVLSLSDFKSNETQNIINLKQFSNATVLIPNSSMIDTQHVNIDTKLLQNLLNNIAQIHNNSNNPNVNQSQILLQNPNDQQTIQSHHHHINSDIAQNIPNNMIPQIHKLNNIEQQNQNVQQNTANSYQPNRNQNQIEQKMVQQHELKQIAQQSLLNGKHFSANRNEGHSHHQQNNHKERLEKPSDYVNIDDDNLHQPNALEVNAKVGDLH